LRGSRSAFFYYQRHQFPLGVFVTFWPDRLTHPRWRSRCRLEGQWDLVNAGGKTRPVIFVSLHFGPFVALPYLLRSQGIAVAIVTSEPGGWRSDMRNYKRSLSPPLQKPFSFSLNQIRQARGFLQPGNHLLLMLDSARGRQIRLPFSHGIFRMATGPIRLAASSGALLVPILATEPRPWEFVIRCGSPVPEHLLAADGDPKLIADFLLKEFFVTVSRHPEQCSSILLNALEPFPGQNDEDRIEPQ
jgi:lauroyl/myristoyl acyltransferase